MATRIQDLQSPSLYIKTTQHYLVIVPHSSLNLAISIRIDSSYCLFLCRTCRVQCWQPSTHTILISIISHLNILACNANYCSVPGKYNYSYFTPHGCLPRILQQTISTCRMSADNPSIVEQLDTVSLHAILMMDEVPSAVALLHSMRGSVVFCSSSHSSIIAVHDYRKEYF